jgi:hypothetical protein
MEYITKDDINTKFLYKEGVETHYKDVVIHILIPHQNKNMLHFLRNGEAPAFTSMDAYVVLLKKIFKVLQKVFRSCDVQRGMTQNPAEGDEG